MGYGASGLDGAISRYGRGCSYPKDIDYDDCMRRKMPVLILLGIALALGILLG